jgi:hypothetical protein
LVHPRPANIRSSDYRQHVPPNVPERDRDVYLVGAGVSTALGLPNTPSLIDAVLDLAKGPKHWLQSDQLPDRLDSAFRYFYPDAQHAGFRPDVVDFFSVLRTYLDVGSGFAGGLTDAPLLYRSLRFAISNLLIERIRHCDDRLRRGHQFLDEIVQPGNIVITSNWDFAIERYAQHVGVPVRLAGSRETELVVLKLHGSIDWCLGTDMSSNYPASDYATLNERLYGERPYQPALPAAKERAATLVRIRAVEELNRSWRLIRSRADELHMVTMGRAKSGDLGPLTSVWRDAYAAISRAATLKIVGYSMPDDDIEIRTLLRAGIRRGSGPKRLVVKNPAPDVHDRVRRYLIPAEPDYLPVDAL